MKTNMINTNSMKNYSKYICMFLMLVGMSVNAWGVTINLNTSTNVFSLNTSGNDASSETEKTVGGYTYKLKASNSCYYFSSKALLIGKQYSYITFPAISGKKLTSVTIWNCAGAAEPEILICPTGNTTAVSGGSAATVSKGSSQTWTLSGTSANTAYRAYINSKHNLQMTGLQLVYSNTTAYTVSFSAISGTPTESSITEASESAGITLPDVTPNDDVKAVGWDFFGWATSSNKPASLTESAPSIVGKAGDKYYPESNETLYAVYAKGEFTKVTSTGGITSGGKYIIVGDDNNEERKQVWQMGDNYRGDGPYYEMQGHLLGQGDTRLKDSYKTVDLYSGRYVITGSAGSYVIKNEADTKYIDVYLNDWFTSSSSRKNTITFGEGGLCSIRNNTGGYLVVFVGGSFGDSADTWARMLLYKETTASEYSCTPPNATLRLVASPAAGGTVVFDDNSSAEMDFATAEGYSGDIIATPNDGYDFVNWVSSDEDVAIVDAADDQTTELTATESATITANFYQRRSISYNLTEGGVAGVVGNPTTVTKTEKDGFVVRFNLQAHYKDMTLVSVTMGGSPITEGEEADYEWEVDDGTAMLTIHHANIDGDIVITVSATLMEYTKYAFSCAELTLTPKLVTAGTPMFITSAAGKTVRSQDYIEITGSGLTPSTALTFPSLPSEFAIKNADGTAISTDVNGVISANAYIFYTPDAGDTEDGLDKLTGITVSVGGAKPKTVVLTQDIIGRHLPADFVIAGKVGNKWYALPADFSEESTPDPVEIAVNDINNPSLAYTASTNIYNLYGQNSGASGFLYNDGDDDGNPDGEKIKLGMKNNSNKPLFAFASPKNSLKGDGTATVTNNINKQYWWTLKQTNTTTNITNAQDAKYILTSSNNSGTLSIKNSPFVWGTYATGVEELRLIPASDIVFTEAYFVEWGQHGGVIEVDAQGIDATSVTAHLGVNSATTTLSQTLTSGKSRASKYNYTVNFGNGIDFAAAASNGAMLTLEWKNGATTKAVSNIVVPKIVASDITINKTNYPLKSDWNTEVHVLPGKTVTIDADYSPNPDVTIKELNIYPGATVVASTGTLIATNLVLRNGWSRAGTKKYDVARLHVTASAATLKATNVYADWYIDYDQYYPVAVPWDVTLSGITYRYCSVEPSVGPSKNIRLKYYDGESRATNVQEGVGSGANWKTYGDAGCTDVPTKLEPSKGYAMTAKRPTGKAFSIIRMPLTIPNADWISGGEKGEVGGTHKDQVSVTAWGTGSTPTYAQGWNLIANPYMSLHQGAISYTGSGTLVTYVNIPDVDFKEYDQKPTALTKLAPASAFLIKAPETGTITFGTENRKASAPSYRTEEKPESIPEQQAYIVLSNEQSEDMMGILVSEKYTSEYETNADLEKLLSDGNTLRTYMRYGDMNMAYVAINEMLAKEWIPVTVRIPADGEYTFSLHEASIAGELEGVYLIDYQNGDKVTNLIEQSYTFSSTAGTINGRFAINAKTGERQTPTGIDAINAGGDINSDKPFKFIYHDKVYIWLNGIIYDTTGKRVK